MESGSSPPTPGVRSSSEICRASATSMTSVRDSSASGGSRQCEMAADTAGGRLQAMARCVPTRASWRAASCSTWPRLGRDAVLEHGRADAAQDHGHADAMQQAAQIGGFDVAALEARDLLREQRGDHRLAPQVGHLVAEVGRVEHLALHGDREGDVADLADAQPGDGLRQRDHRRAARVQRRVRDAHHLAGERDVALDELRELRRAGVAPASPATASPRVRRMTSVAICGGGGSSSDSSAMAAFRMRST